MFLSLTLTFALVAEVTGSGRKSGAILKAIQVDKTVTNAHVNPALEPESSKKFEKDLAGDKKPKVDVLHFKHPYPVVQDSDDFDKDFVKDENTDNGEFKAQTEYDRLRHKLARLKKEAAEALEKKNKAKAELEAETKQYAEDMTKEEAEIVRKKEAIVDRLEAELPAKPVKPEKPTAPVKPAPIVRSAPAVKEQKQSEPEKKVQSEPEKKEESKGWWPFSWPWSSSKTETPEIPKAEAPEIPKVKIPKTEGTYDTESTPESIDNTETHAAARDVEQAMENLKECQRQLEEAKAELKKLMDELEAAKVKQAAAQEKVKQAVIRQSDAEKNEEKMHESYDTYVEDYRAAVQDYEAQKAVYEKLKAQLEAAAAKVKALRDAEDKNGGVYNVPDKKSGASSLSFQFLVLALATAAGW